MQTRPAVAVTATTELIRGVVRVRANASYTGSLASVGLRPYILPVMRGVDAEAMLDGMCGLVLTGGEDVDPSHYGAPPHPSLGDIHAGRDEFEIALVLAARARKLPTLAICRGIQVANVALGGTLVQDLPSEWAGALDHDSAATRDRRVHPVSVQTSSALSHALGATSLDVNSFHHQAVASVAPGLAVVARAADGVIEGVEWVADDWWMLGVQWHPEELTGSPESWDRQLFTSFARAAGAERPPDGC